MVGYGKRRHAELRGAVYQVADANGAVEEAVFGVVVQMDERRTRLHDSPTPIAQIFRTQKCFFLLPSPVVASSMGSPPLVQETGVTV